MSWPTKTPAKLTQLTPRAPLPGVILTIITIPDVTGLDLREGDRRWLAILDGHHDAYTGECVLTGVG